MNLGVLIWVHIRHPLLRHQWLKEETTSKKLSSDITPKYTSKISVELENDGLEDDYPFPGVYSQCSMLIFRGVTKKSGMIHFSKVVTTVEPSRFDDVLSSLLHGNMAFASTRTVPIGHTSIMEHTKKGCGDYPKYLGGGHHFDHCHWMIEWSEVGFIARDRKPKEDDRCWKILEVEGLIDFDEDDWHVNPMMQYMYCLIIYFLSLGHHFELKRSGDSKSGRGFQCQSETH